MCAVSKKIVINLDTIKINSIFALFKKKENMEIKEKANITLRVTETEENLILAIRNYCNSYPNGYPDLLEYAQDIFDRLTSMPR